ncbi:hypothetical protein CPT_MarsHill_033 [Staphylococcus phage MarsHill]|nr:hypothetical protein CPT_MarsHill_033 [Staphylococcus phage MarsHill]
MLNDTKKVLDRMYDKINGDLIVISECIDLFDKELNYTVTEGNERTSNLDYLADSLIVVASDIFTLNEVLNIDEETINNELLSEFKLSYRMIQNFHMKLELNSYQLKEIKTSIE